MLVDLIIYRRHPLAHRKLPYWRSKEGYVAIRDITDRHLINIALYLYRHIDSKLQDEIAEAYEFASAFDSDSMASYYADQMVAELEDYADDPTDYLEQIYAEEIFKELDKRKIDIHKILYPPIRVIFDD